MQLGQSIQSLLRLIGISLQVTDLFLVLMKGLRCRLGCLYHDMLSRILLECAISASDGAISFCLVQHPLCATLLCLCVCVFVSIDPSIFGTQTLRCELYVVVLITDGTANMYTMGSSGVSGKN